LYILNVPTTLGIKSAKLRIIYTKLRKRSTNFPWNYIHEKRKQHNQNYIKWQCLFDESFFTDILNSASHFREPKSSLTRQLCICRLKSDSESRNLPTAERRPIIWPTLICWDFGCVIPWWVLRNIPIRLICRRLIGHEEHAYKCLKQPLE